MKTLLISRKPKPLPNPRNRYSATLPDRPSVSKRTRKAMGVEAAEWVEIVEPRSGEHMYANLSTGECAWEPPEGVPVKPTDAGQWWELFDPNTARFYYYNAASQTTVWHRPPHSDIIPLAKLQTLKQNTDAGGGGGFVGSYDVPRSPSSTSTQSTPSHRHRSPLQDPRTSALRSNTATSSTTTQTQTSPSASPRAHKKHHHHRHGAARNPLQETLDRQIATMSSQRAPPLSPNSQQQPQDPHDILLKLKTDEITAEVERFFEANQDRLAGVRSHEPKFPTAARPPVAHSPSGSSTTSEGRFGRGADAPPLPPHAAMRHDVSDGQHSPILALRKAASSVSSSSFRPDATGERSRGEARARVVRTAAMESSTQSLSQHDLAPAGSESSGSRDSTPNAPRRQRSLDLPTAMRTLPFSTVANHQPSSPLQQRQTKMLNAAATVKEAQITSIAGSPKLWGTKQRSKAEPGETTTPVWAARSELAMIKSLDSGIRSAESTGDRNSSPPNASPSKAPRGMETDSSLDASPRGTTAASPKPKPRLSVNSKTSTFASTRGGGVSKGSRERTAELVSLAKPYQQLAPHLTFSQHHQQLILGGGDAGLDSSVDTVGSGSRHKDGGSSEEEDVRDDDDVFADDEDFGELSPTSAMSSQEDLRRSEGSRDSESRPSPNSTANAYSSHYHPPQRTVQPSVREAFLDSHHLNGNFLNSNTLGSASKRRSGPDSANLPQRNSMDKPISAYPGDITPPSHRPASMLVGGGADIRAELPPNTATLSRASKRAGGTGSEAWREEVGWGVGVSRSASSLTRATQLSTPAEAEGTPLINCHKKGLFGKRQSFQSMMTWSRDTLRKPLIMTNAKEVKKDAVGVFKRIQAYMGDRKVKAGVQPDQLAHDIVTKGWLHPALRDEIFIQICKQTTDNPKTESLRRGWELMGVCLSVFAPSLSMFSFLESYVGRNADPVLDPPEVPVSHYAQHCAKKLDRALGDMGAPGGTGGGSKRGLRKPTLEEVEEARIQIFNPSMFGNTLEEVMGNQRDKFPLRQLPWIQTTLSEMVLQLNGAQTEGIFRVPGDIDEVNALKVRMDRWLVPLVPDPHVPASLLKLWYRELAQPLIPPAAYDDAVLCGDDPTAACALLDRLPRINRLVLAYLIRFLQVMMREENARATKMDSSNLAMVMAPNILRCHSDDPRIIFENTRKEMAFIRTLMCHYDTSFMEGLL